MKTDQVAQGEKISGKQVSNEKYMPFYEFLMYDSTYFKLSPNAKLLYTFLRNKLKYFEHQTEAFEQGFEGSKSYKDNSGFIYIIADNTELTYLLQISEPTLVKIKKELARYGLLEEVKIKDRANHIYIKQPVSLDEKWTYIEVIKELRSEKQKENQAKQEKYNNQKIAAASLQPSGNLKNLSHGNLKNLSHGNLKNLSKIQSNVFKSTIISKIQSNLSDSEIPEVIQNTVLKQIDKIDENKIDIIISLYDTYKEALNPMQFNAVLKNVLEAKIKRSFKGLLEKSLKTEIADIKESESSEGNSNNKPVRTEIIPEHMDKEYVQTDSPQEIERNKKKMDDILAKLRA